jgi:hypothetical protein
MAQPECQTSGTLCHRVAHSQNTDSTAEGVLMKAGVSGVMAVMRLGSRLE